MNSLHVGGNLKPEADSTWMAEKEPHATMCDSWARGAVVVKKKKKVKKGKPHIHNYQAVEDH